MNGKSKVLYDQLGFPLPVTNQTFLRCRLFAVEVTLNSSGSAVPRDFVAALYHTYKSSLNLQQQTTYAYDANII